MSDAISEIGKLTDRIKSSLKFLGDLRVLVGVPESKAARDNPSLNNAYLAAIHENGSAVRGIPPRPFLIPGIRKAQPQVVKILEQACFDAVVQTDYKPRRAIDAAGLAAENSVKKMFTDNDWKKLSDLTITGLKKKDGTYLWEGRKKTKKMQADFDEAMTNFNEATTKGYEAMVKGCEARVKGDDAIAAGYEAIAKAYETAAKGALDPIRDQYRPLIDTGQLRKSISYVVVNESEVKD
jgi:hypothetical protein